MQIEETAAGDVRILRLGGELDAPDARELLRSLESVGRATAIVVSLSDLTFVSATAIDCIVQARAKARKRTGEIVLSAPSPFLRAMLCRLGLEGTFRIFPDEDAAIRYLRGPERTLAAS
jgi:anti-anti-sigma factor